MPAIYPCDTAADARRAVATTLFQNMRWTFWYELADALRYVAVTADGINGALDSLLDDGRIERMTAGDGRYIYRIRL